MYVVNDMSNIQKHIMVTRNEFENCFLEGNYYNKQTRDEKHRELIIEHLNIKRGSRVLDLGTGNGFLAFALACRNPFAGIVGLDIIEETLKRNRTKASELDLFNLNFYSYDGITFPFEEDAFDVIVCRYAAHHFPDLTNTFKEISRVLKSGGQLFISDPCPNAEDDNRFVDEFMRMKFDGHVKLYTHDELNQTAQGFYLIENASFDTKMRFPRKDPSLYEELIGQYDKDIIDGYEIEVFNNEIYITEKVNNISFINCKGFF